MLHLQPWHGLALLHAAAVAGGLLLYVGLTHSGRQRRPPSAAMAWVLALLAFPYLALPTYLLLGTRKLAHAATSGEGAQPPSRLADDPATRGLDLPPPRRCASVRIHGRGDEALQALLDLLAGAQRRIDVEIFIFRDDEVGRRIVEALASASRRGVMVRALIDGLGTLENHRRIRADLHAAGVRTRWFSPIRLRLRPQFGRGNLRNHRKLVLVDGRTLWSGGRNFAAEYFLGTSGTPAWHDLSFCIESGIVADAAEGFARDWALAGGTPDVTPPFPTSFPRARSRSCCPAARTVARIPPTRSTSTRSTAPTHGSGLLRPTSFPTTRCSFPCCWQPGAGRTSGCCCRRAAITDWPTSPASAACANWPPPEFASHCCR